MNRRRRNNIREEAIDKILDRLCHMREELLAIERSLERVQTAKVEQGKDSSSKHSRVVR
jgi:hypothetical protein